ncbi:glycosyltransferase family 1 protein [Acidithiobacillus thiooxidans]|uniref:glycosyltransferase family 4 protein n=1 Tax=Acidithiobacillus thiooxidans TaxID=930 RepID=UPI0002625293|nr:glycosyltransferase family 1 protein [Acidithiobacillus thiooxidans]MBU2809897.1 glycosyltransferase family 1 protein [Acidithiobacillus thiooxidans]
MTTGKLRIALITETYPPEINGVALTLGKAVEELRSRGHEVRVIRPRQSDESAQEGLVKAFPLFFYPQVKLGWASPGYINDCLQSWSSEVVHIATEGPLGYAALIAARKLRLPVVTSFHTNFDQYFSLYGIPALHHLARLYLRHFHNATRQTLVPSQGTLRRLHQQGFLHLQQWGRGVDTQRFNPQWRDAQIRQDLGLSDEDLLLLYVGRLAREKNLPPLIAAYRKLSRNHPRAILVLVGDGPLRSEINQYTNERIYCAGMQSGMNLARWYASADLFCFPSCSETFGNVVLEAQASALPIIAYDCPGVCEQVIHGENGLLLPRDSDLETAMQTLYSNPTERQRLGKAGRLRAESQSWTRSFDILEATYQQQLSAR